jgi:hypothetical protein
MSEEKLVPEWASTALPVELHDIPFLKDATDLNMFKTRLTSAAQHMGNSLRIPGPDAGPEDWLAFDEKITAKIPNLHRIDLGTEEGRANIMKQLGRPDAATDYGAEGDGQWLADVALAAGLTKNQFNDLVKGVGDRQINKKTEQTVEHKEAIDALNNEWGLAAPQKMEHIKGLAKLTQAPETLVAQLEAGEVDATTLRWMDGLAKQFITDKNFTQDRNDATTLTPVEAKAQIQEILNNPEYFKNTAIGTSLRNKMLELQKASNPTASADINSLRGRTPGDAFG